eukprot:COSAG02_NODE_959_length_15647_cov_74.362748_1_plen_300_part_00
MGVSADSTQGARTQRSESPHSDRNRRCPPRSKSAPGGTSRGSLFLFFFFALRAVFLLHAGSVRFLSGRGGAAHPRADAGTLSAADDIFDSARRPKKGERAARPRPRSSATAITNEVRFVSAILKVAALTGRPPTLDLFRPNLSFWQDFCELTRQTHRGHEGPLKSVANYSKVLKKYTRLLASTAGPEREAAVHFEPLDSARSGQHMHGLWRLLAQHNALGPLAPREHALDLHRSGIRPAARLRLGHLLPLAERPHRAKCVQLMEIDKDTIQMSSSTSISSIHHLRCDLNPRMISLGVHS